MKGAEQVLRMQAANVTQKAQLDVLVTKVVRSQQIVHGLIMQTSAKAFTSMTKPELVEALSRETGAIVELSEVLSMDRHEAQAMRPTFELDNPEIQAILDRAVDDMTAVLLRTT